MSTSVAPLDVEALRMEIAKRHNVLLAPNDPIWAAVTLNQLVLEHYVSRVEAASNAAEAKGAAATAQHMENAKKIAEGMIAGAAKYIAEEVRKVADQAQQRAATGAHERLAAVDRAAAKVEKDRGFVSAALFGTVVLCVLVLGVVIGLAASR